MNQELSCRLTPREDGFVLIGAVIFVLALTILGLSLFSLSGYEAQFLGQTANEGKAFYYATGGIERAKFALISQKTLQSVKSNLPNEGVVYARARYADSPYESTGTVSFTGTRAISIRVLATANGERSMVETQFRPQQSPQYYKRLATSFTHLDINVSVPANLPHTWLYGEVWQNDGLPGTATWTSPPAGHAPTLVPTPVVIPHPDVKSIIDAHPGSPAPTKNGHKYRLYGSPGVPTYFESSSGPSNSFWDQATANPTPEIDVKGIAVWMVRKGMRFNFKVDVESDGGPGDCLVILCEGNGDFSGYPGGIWFAGGLNSDDVPIILVSNGRVEIEEDLNQPGQTTTVDYLSIFAGDILVIGPKPGSNVWDMYLRHDPLHPNDAPSGLIDQLTNLGVLPNANTQDKLNQVRGQWAQLDPDNPPN